MSWPTHNIGDLVRITADFEDINGTPTDPTTVTLKVMDPSGNIDTYTYSGGSVTKSATGSFYREVTADERGDWYAWWESTGSAQGGEPTQWSVEGTPFT